MASARAARAASAARRPAAVSRRATARPSRVAAVALDEPARLQAVGQAHDAGVRERERAAQQVERLALGVVAQGHERGGVAARRRRRRRCTAAPARSDERQREGAEEVGGALVRGHGGTRSSLRLRRVNIE